MTSIIQVMCTQDIEPSFGIDVAIFLSVTSGLVQFMVVGLLIKLKHNSFPVLVRTELSYIFVDIDFINLCRDNSGVEMFSIMR